MSMLEATLAGAAVLIGLTGAWSPCGFSMVETIGLSGDGGRRWTTIAACATFVPGALLGGVLTFGSLSALGEAIHGAGGRLAYLVAAGIAVAAAAAEARGMRIVPQVRRQLPEGWRWTMSVRARTTSGRECSARGEGDGHPGYLSTARMLGEAGIMLSREGLAPQGGGCLTPAIALGSDSAERLQRAGVRFSLGD